MRAPRLAHAVLTALAVVLAGHVAAADCDAVTNSTFKIATHCLGKGSDPEDCKEIGELYGYDACTDPSIKDKCKAMCYRCPISVELWLVISFMIITVVAAIVVFYRKKWLRFHLATHELLSAKETNGEPTSRSRALLIVRLVVFLYTLSIMLWGMGRGVVRHWGFVYFTIWNYTTMVLVFGLLLAHSVLPRLPRWLTCVTWTLFQVEITNALLLDTIFWLFLYDGCGVEFQMVNVHAINAIFILVEFGLNQITLVNAQVVFVSAYALTYTMVTWFLYLNGYQMPYPFLHVGPDTSVLWYLGLSTGLAIVFFALRGVSLLKEKYVLKLPIQQYARLDGSNTDTGSDYAWE